MKSVRDNVLCVAAVEPGECRNCRHANQGTADFAEGHVFCRWDDRPRRRATLCNATMDLPRTMGGAAERAYLYERFDGGNGTFAKSIDVRVIAADCDLEIKKAARWNEPVIAKGEGLT